MTTVTANDLQEIKDLIMAQSGQIQKEISDLRVSVNQIEATLQSQQQEISDLRGSVGKIEATLQSQQPYLQKIPDLAERVGEPKNWKQIGLTLSGTLIGGAITYLMKTPTP